MHFTMRFRTTAAAILAGIPIAGAIPTIWQVFGLLVLSAGMLIAVYSPDAECFLSGRPAPPIGDVLQCDQAGRERTRPECRQRA